MDQCENMATPSKSQTSPEKRRQSPISKSDIARLADIVRREQVVVELEMDGRLIRVSPMPSQDYGGNSASRRGGVVL